LKVLKDVVIPNKIRYYRVFYNKTQKEMSEMLKINTNLYRKIENNMVYPGTILRRRLLIAFDLSYEQLFQAT